MEEAGNRSEDSIVSAGGEKTIAPVDSDCGVANLGSRSVEQNRFGQFAQSPRLGHHAEEALL